MSNGDPVISRAPYIIICSGRIEAFAAKSTHEKIVVASNCAAQLCGFLESKYEIEAEDFAAVSSLQHYLMDNMMTMSKDEADTKVAEMFTLLDALEHEYGGEEHEY